MTPPVDLNRATPRDPKAAPAQLARAANRAETAALRSASSEMAAASAKAFENLKLSSRLVPSLMVAVTIVGTAVANVVGMSDARANWNALAKELEVALPGVIGNTVFLSRGNWQADDREAFLHAAAELGGQLQKLSGVCYNMEGSVNDVRTAYVTYWTGIGTLAAAVLAYIVAAQRLRRTPATAAAAELQLQRLSVLVNSRAAQMTMLLGGFLTLMGTTMTSLVAEMSSLNHVMPTENLKIDFRSIEISTAPPSAWVAPKREVGAPIIEEPDPQVDRAIKTITNIPGG
ncbi:hypothetical protein [Streptosporangium sp. CA-115845]|uniref:hypothetical protein n=1 Tax=Streptosporangium sp. CA-115845 TaxID=3240071 RepID=UPI003D9421DC